MYQNDNLAADAQRSLQYVNQGAGQQRPCGDITHDTGNLDKLNEGENLFTESVSNGDFSTFTYATAINSFMSEDSLYFQYSNAGADPAAGWNGALNVGQEIGHFTQIVWASTNSVGCAKRQCNHYQSGWPTIMVACRYQARGNIFNGAGLIDPFYN